MKRPLNERAENRSKKEKLNYKHKVHGTCMSLPQEVKPDVLLGGSKCPICCNWKLKIEKKIK